MYSSTYFRLVWVRSLCDILKSSHFPKEFSLYRYIIFRCLVVDFPTRHQGEFLASRRVTRNPLHNDYCLFRSPLDGNNTTFMESTEWSRNGLNSARFLAPSIPLSSTSMGYGFKNGEYYILYKILWKEPLMYTPAILRGWKASRSVAQTRRMEFSQS